MTLNIQNRYARAMRRPVLFGGLMAMALGFLSPAPSAASYAACIQTAEANGAAGLEAAKTLEQEGDPIAAQHCRGLAYSTLGEHGRAGAIFSQVSRSLPAHEGSARAEILSMAGHSYTLAQDFNAARTAFDEALALVPNLPRLTPYLLVDRAQLALMMNDCVGVEADAGRALEFLPELADAALLRATCRRLEGNLSGARTDLSLVLALQPRNPNAILESAILQLALDDVVGARAGFNQVVAVAPETAAAQFARSELAKLDARDQMRQ